MKRIPTWRVVATLAAAVLMVMAWVVLQGSYQGNSGRPDYTQTFPAHRATTVRGFPYVCSVRMPAASNFGDTLTVWRPFQQATWSDATTRNFRIPIQRIDLFHVAAADTDSVTVVAYWAEGDSSTSFNVAFSPQDRSISLPIQCDFARIKSLTGLAAGDVFAVGYADR